jgi:hypothetical protein
LFRHLLLQIGGANIENPPPSSSLAEEERLRSFRVHCSLRSLRLALRERRLPTLAACGSLRLRLPSGDD